MGLPPARLASQPRLSPDLMLTGDTQLTASAPPLTMTWEEFSEHAIFDNVTAVSRFLLTIAFPRFVAWPDLASMTPYQDTLYEAVYELLAQSKLYRFEDLHRNQETSRIGIAYKDSDFEFDVDLTQDAQLLIYRPGSSFELFYEWYRRVMPHISIVVDAVRN